jgi:hypothetical protein
MGLQMYAELKDFGYLMMWGIVAITAIAWIIYEIKDTAFQNGYWKGRAQGWESHRRLMNTKLKSDEVFDYDKN